MLGSFTHGFSWLNLKKFFSRLSPFPFKMVRHFPNPYADFQPNAGLVVAVTKEDVKPQLDEYVQNILKRLQANRKNTEGGLYIGTTGVSYMFYHISKNPLLSEKRAAYIEKSVEYLKPALDCSIGDKTSFILGDAGTLAMAIVAYKDIDQTVLDNSLQNYKALLDQYLNPTFLKCGGDEFFVGRTGYLFGALWISRELKTQVFSSTDLYKICDAIVASGREYSAKQNSPCPLMYHYYNTEYIGAAHGISTILQVLLSVPGYLQYDEEAAKDIRDTVEFIASLQVEDGNWPCCLDEIHLKDHKLIHWCHGAPGTVYLMAKAFLVFQDQIYLNCCKKAADVVWQRGLLRKGPGICHGVAGNAYVFLLLYRLTAEEKYLYRARKFAEFMTSEEFHRDARLPDNPVSLYEGLAGTVCFLSDLVMPENAEFPFLDVFSTAPVES